MGDTSETEPSAQEASGGPGTPGGPVRATARSVTGFGRTAVRHRWWVVATAVAAAVVLALALSVPEDPRGPATTSSLPPGVGLGTPVEVDPSVEFAAPVLVQQLSLVSRGTGLVSGYLLPCQRAHSVELTRRGDTVDVELLAGVPRGTTDCEGDPVLVTTTFAVPVSLQDLPLRPAGPER